MITPKDCTNIHEVREQIDELDFQIMNLFSLRQGFVERIVDFKKNKKDIIAEDRQGQVYKKCRANAEKLGLNPDVFENIYTLLIDHNIKEEIKLFKAHSKNT